MRIHPLFLLLPFLAFAQNTLPTFDGVVNPDEWSSAEKHAIEYEISPGNNTPSPVATEVYITYDVSDLYVGFIAYADMSTLRSSIRNRDEGYQDDFVMIGIDTYGDGRYMVSLGANAEGNQLDLKFLPSGNDDTSYNVSYESKASKHQDAYHVELKIPFSVLQFKNKPTMKWNILLYRSTYTADSRSQNINFPIDLNNPCLACQTPVSLTLNNIKAKNRVEFLPYVYGGLSGEREDNALKFGKLNKTVGLSGLVDLNNVTSLEYAINPDFSQVEADVTQIDVNSSFSLQYPERRPFFNRGTDLVNFTDGAFYSRSIINPSIATKLISQGKKSRLFLLNALDKNSVYLVGGEDRSYSGLGGQSLVNVLRYQHLLSPKSRFGGVIMNKFYKGGGFGHLFGFDGLFLLNQNLRLSFEVFKNINEEPINDWIDTDATINGKTIALDGDKINGDALYIQLYRKTEHWQSYLFYRNISPQYRSDVGFVVKNNRRWGTLFHEYINIINKPALQSFGFGTKVDLVYTFEDLYKNLSVDLFASIKTFGQTELKYTLDYDAVKTFLEVRFNNLPTHSFSLNGSPSESFNFRASIDSGKDLSVNEEVPEVGKLKSSFLSLNFQVNDNLIINPSLRYSKLERLDGSGNYFEGNIARLNVRYQFSNAFNIRLISQKNTFTNQFFIQPLVQWNPNPSTIFYFGGNQNTIEEIEGAHFQLLQFNQTQFFFKFQYLIGL